MRKPDFVQYCLSKPGAFLDFPFGPRAMIVKVGPPGGRARIFAQFFTLQGEEKATLNCDRATGEAYRARYPGAVDRGYHCPPVQQPYFNTMALDGRVPNEVILEMIDHAYRVVVAKLSKGAQKELENRSL